MAVLSRATQFLVLNAGSSSLKSSVIEIGTEAPLASAQTSWGSDATRVASRGATVNAALDDLWRQGVDPARLAGSGHRIVHGGSRFREPVLVDEAVLGELDELTELAPLHNPVAVDTLRATLAVLPGLPAVAVFDTGFHATLSEEAFVYPLPWRWYEEWGIRRYGFHGLSVAWSVRRAAALLGGEAARNLVVAHLGNGCSITAVLDGRSVSTSMGMTPLEGVAMGTRSGSVDPGILIQVVRERGLSVDELADVLEHQSGLLGMSGVSGDVREVQRAAEAGSHRARLALDVFIRRAAAGIAVAAVALPRLDAIVFTGGIGEHAVQVRTEICRRLSVLDVGSIVDATHQGDAVLSRPGQRPAVVSVHAREDLVIAEGVAAVLA